MLRPTADEALTARLSQAYASGVADNRAPGAGHAAPGRTCMHKLFRYTVVGAFATATHYALLVLGVEAAGWPAWWASGFGAVVGAQVAYVGNRRYTFGYRGGIGGSWVRFQTTALAGALLGMLIVGVTVRSGWHYLLGQVAATLASLLLTFAINRCWTFR